MPDPVAKAKSYLGKPYVWGGDCPDGVDCSGLVHQVYPSLPRVAREQYNATQRIPQSQLQAGDLVFYHGTQKGLPKDYASHVGVYDGVSNVIHASSTHGKVVSVPLAHFTSNPNFYGFGRVDPALKLASSTLDMTKATAKPKTPPPVARPDKTQFQDPNLALRQQLIQGLATDANTVPQSPLMTPNRGLTDALGFGQQVPAAPFGLGPVSQVFNPQPQQAGPVAPVPQAQGLTPFELLQHLSQQAVDARPNAEETELANVRARQADVAAQKAYLAGHPAQQMQARTLQDTPFPTLQQPALPTRPAPGQDTASAVLAGLAGIIDPIGAGHYNAAPIQAGIQVADQQYADRQRTFQQATQQAQALYEQQIAARQAALQNAIYNNQALNQADEYNQSQMIARQKQELGLAGPAASADSLAGSLPVLAGRQHTADADTNQIGLLNGYVTDAEKMQALAAQQGIKKGNLLQHLLTVDANNNYHDAMIGSRDRNADQRAGVQQRGQDMTQATGEYRADQSLAGKDKAASADPIMQAYRQLRNAKMQRDLDSPRVAAYDKAELTAAEKDAASTQKLYQSALSKRNQFDQAAAKGQIQGDVPTQRQRVYADAERERQNHVNALQRYQDAINRLPGKTPAGAGSTHTGPPGTNPPPASAPPPRPGQPVLQGNGFSLTPK